MVMATVYPATTYAEAVNLTMTAGNQLHEIINGSPTDEVTTESGLVPSVRKALADSMLFKPALDWVDGSVESDPFQTRLFEGQIYWAPNATNATPIAMGVSPKTDSNWYLAPISFNEQALIEITDIVYKSSGSNSAVENMVLGKPVSVNVGETCQCENGTIFKRIGNAVGGLSDYKPITSLNVLDFGALGLPYVNNTPFFQLAIDTASVAGGNVFVPDGEFPINGVILKSNVNITGSHKDSSRLVFFNYSQGDRMLANYYGSESYYNRNGDYLDNVIIRNLSLVSDSQARTGVVDEFDSPLYILNPSCVVVEDCNLWKSVQSVTIESSPDKRALDNRNKITFNRVQFYDQAYIDSDTSFGSNSYLNVITAVHNGTVSNCTFNGSHGSTTLRIFESVVGDEAVGSSGWLIDNNTFKNQSNVTGNSAYGIYMRAQSTRITNNLFHDLDGNYIDTQNSELLSAPNILSHHKDIVIQNNTFRLTDSANFREDAIIHCRNSGIRIDSNTFVADWSGSSGTNKDCITAKWGESVSITNNEFTTSHYQALELSSTFTRELEYKAMLISGNVFRTGNNSNLGIIRINTFRDFSAVISNNTFMRIDNGANITNALWAVWYDDGFGINRAKVWFTGNRGYLSPMSTSQDIIDFEEIDGDFNYSVTVDPENANITNPKIGAMPDIDSVYNLLLPRSGIVNGVIDIDVVGSSAGFASIEQRRIPNITINVSSSNGSSIVNTTIFKSTIARLTFSGLNFSSTGTTYAIYSESESKIPLITVTDCTWVSGGNGIKLFYNATIYVSNCDMGSSPTAFVLSDMVRVAIVNTTGSGRIYLSKGTTGQMQGSSLGSVITSAASSMVTIP